MSDTEDPNAKAGSPSTLSGDLAAVGRRDAAALRRVYDATAPRLYLICYRITCSRSGADDVLQETFIKIWNRAPGYDPARNPMAWLAAIARNSAIDWYRANNRHVFVSDEAISRVVDEAEPVDDRILREEREHRALDLLSGLPAEQETEIRAIFFRGLTYRELAEREGLPLATLKSRVRRALITIKSKFEHD